MATAETGDGRFAVRAWDRRTEEKEFDWTTMFGSIGLAAVIAGVGLGLFFSQQRVWRASEQRVSFVNRVSHELGTPLTNMTLNLELASRSLRSHPEVAGRRLEKVSEEVSRLGRLVSNVLTHSRKASDGVQDRSVACDPDSVIAGVLDQFRPALERRKIQVEWLPGEVGEQRLNADALSQIVWNLISNVEKYASSGEWLSVSVSKKDDAIKVRVCDRGEAIPRERRRRIFKPFERVSDSTKEGVSGTGLGLSISRDLAEAMGGTLELVDDSEMTIFELTIPLKTT
jgi:signal transduction histidine kinase